MLAVSFASWLGCARTTPGSEADSDLVREVVPPHAREVVPRHEGEVVPPADREVVPPHGGGQSGGEGSTVCQTQPQPLATAVRDGVRVAELVDTFRAALRRPVTLQWWPRVRRLDEPIPATQLVVSDVSIGDTADVGEGGCNSFRLPAKFRTRTADGLLDGEFEGELDVFTLGERSISFSASLADGGSLSETVKSGLTEGDDIQITLQWRELDSQFSGNMTTPRFTEPFAWIGALVPDEWTAAMPSKDSIIFEPSEVQQRACRSVQEPILAAFMSDDAFRRALTRTWVVCSGSGRVSPAFAGFAINAEGHWHELRTESDALIAVQGFGHEGQIIRNVFGPNFNVAILDWLPTRYDFALAGLSPNGNTLRLITQGGGTLDATFQAVDLPVQYPAAQYDKGARAGLAACNQGEADVISRPASIDAMRDLLVGRWKFCRGKMGTKHAGVTFAADGTYRFLDGEDRVVRGDVGKYAIIDTSSMNGPGAYQINLYVGEDGAGAMTMPLVSQAPLKIIANDEFGTELSAF